MNLQKRLAVIWLSLGAQTCNAASDTLTLIAHQIIISSRPPRKPKPEKPTWLDEARQVRHG